MGWDGWAAYWSRVWARIKSNVAAHFRTQVGVTVGVGAVTLVIALLIGGGIASVLLGLVAAGLWVLLAAGFYLLRAPAELDRELTEERDSARAERDVAHHDLEEALGGGRMPVHVKRVERLIAGGQVYLRLMVLNVGQRRATYSARVDRLVGTTPDGPEAPFPAAWRGHDPNAPAGHHSLASGEEQMIDVARGALIVEAQAHNQGYADWGSVLELCIGTPDGSELHRARFSEVASVNDLLSRQAVLTYAILHEESQEYVARANVRVWYGRRDVYLVADMAIDGG